MGLRSQQRLPPPLATAHLPIEVSSRCHRWELARTMPTEAAHCLT